MRALIAAAFAALVLVSCAPGKAIQAKACEFIEASQIEEYTRAYANMKREAVLLRFAVAKGIVDELTGAKIAIGKAEWPADARLRVEACWE
jgi:hypothetical protein